MMETIEEMETNEFNLMDFPNEVLLHIFCNLDDTSLLRAVSVCKRFKSIAEKTFTKKYNGTSEGKYYKFKVLPKNFVEQRKQYLSLVSNFGECMSAIALKFDGYGKIVANNHWLIRLIQRYCVSITKLKITGGSIIDISSIVCNMPRLTDLFLYSFQLDNHTWTKYTYPDLIQFSAKLVRGMNLQDFFIFITHNPQLQHLYLYESLPIDVLHAVDDQLNKLKTLELSCEKDTFTNYSTTFKMDSLEAVTLRYDSSLIPILSSLRKGCNNIEHLCIYRYHGLDIADIEVICSFDALKTLKIYDVYEFPLKLFKKLIHGLPSLTSVSISDAGDICKSHDDLLSVVEMCHRLSTLTLMPFHFSKVPKLNYDFYERFANIIERNGSNLKLYLESEDFEDKTIVSKEEIQFIFASNSDVLSHNILFWKGYDAVHSSSILDLNEKILMKIIDSLDGNDLYAFYQTCKHMQKLVKKYLSEHVLWSTLDPFRHPEVLVGENVYHGLGQHIHRLKLNLKSSCIDDTDLDEVAAYKKKVLTYLKTVNKHCGKYLIALNVDINEEDIEEEIHLSWTNLRELSFGNPINNQTLRMFDCPHLTQLEIQHYEETLVNVPFIFSDSFRNIVSLKFRCYNEHVEKFMIGLSQMICDQLKDLSLDCSAFDLPWFQKKQKDRWIMLINIITRCQHLQTLHVLAPGIQYENFKFLFENTSKLMELSIDLSHHIFNEKEVNKLLYQVKLNCKQIRVVQMVGKAKNFTKSFKNSVRSSFPKQVKLIWTQF